MNSFSWNYLVLLPWWVSLDLKQDGIREGYSRKGGRGILDYSKLKVQGAKIWPNFHFRGWGGLFLTTQNSKCQDLTKFSLGGGGGVFLTTQNSKCRDLTKFSFWWEGLFLTTQNSKCQRSDQIFHFQVGGIQNSAKRFDQIFIFGMGGILDYSKCQNLTKFSFLEGVGMGRALPRIRYSGQNEQKFCHTLEAVASQIVSHTLCVWRLTRR